MEFTKSQIAGLVLGYLKGEKLDKAAKEFYRTSSHFEGKPLTRVLGMRLEDFLYEYASIYTTVQFYLEDCDYYENVKERCGLVQQLKYLLEKHCGRLAASSPAFGNLSEVETTPAHSLPGNSEDELSITKTPKRRSQTNNLTNDDLLDVSEALTRSLLENHELHEKIAESINIARNSTEGAKEKDDHGACQELEAIIKTVVQKTEEDPGYNKLIYEIIGNAAADSQVKNSAQFNGCSSDPSENPAAASKSEDEIDIRDEAIANHNNDAVRSIIEVSQNPTPVADTPKTSETGEVYVFDGTLDTYLKAGAVSTPATSSSLYINTSGLLVMPPEVTPKLYVVNTQPLLNMSVSTVNSLTDTDIMSMPTIIINDDEKNATIAKQTSKTQNEVRNKMANNSVITIPTSSPAVVVTAAQATQATVTSTTRQHSHVRNLDFTTPTKTEGPKSGAGISWDADLRVMTGKCVDKTPPRKKKSGPPKKKKEKEEDHTVDLVTPMKEEVPKTPCVDITDHETRVHGTPFTDVLEEQLKGVDLTSLPTPQLPITPGFTLTPAQMNTYDNRPTDYSTSSSYYQPSDTEQNKSIEQLIERCENREKKSPIKILSEVVIEPAKIQIEEKKDLKSRFNESIIGKKNLSLLSRNPTTTSSSSDASDDDSASERGERLKKARSQEEERTIGEIIRDVKTTVFVDDHSKKKSILAHLEQVRQRTVQKLKSDTKLKKPTKRSKSPKPRTPRTTKRNVKKSEVTPPDDQGQKMVTDLAQRGIHLMPTKTPGKSKEPPKRAKESAKKTERKTRAAEKKVDRPERKPRETKKKEKPTRASSIISTEGEVDEKKEQEPQKEISEDSSGPVYDTKTYGDFEIVIRTEDNTNTRALSSYNLELLKKTVKADVEIEERGKVCFEIKSTAYSKLCELRSTVDELAIYDELMDYSIVGSVRKENSPEKLIFSKGSKKRRRSGDEEKTPPEKKVRNYQNNRKLLKKVDIDNFLDTIHK